MAGADAFRAALSSPTPDRLLIAGQALRAGLTVEDIHDTTKFDPWFLRELERIVMAEREVSATGLPREAGALRRLKALGFSDKRLGELTGTTAASVADLRAALGVTPVYKRIDTCAAEFASKTPYMYSTFEGGYGVPVCEADPTDRTKVIILGGGPNRIGQGIEFDYCCVHAAYALKEAGFETIMVNCNPETVSTDYDTSDRLYFEPLTEEDVIALVRREQAERHRPWLHRPVWRADTAEAVAGLVAGGDPDSWHLGRRHRPGGGPGAIPAASAAAWAAAAGQRDRPVGRGSRRHRRTHRLSGGDPTQLRPGRAGHGDRLRPGRPAPVHARSSSRVRRRQIESGRC